MVLARKPRLVALAAGHLVESCPRKVPESPSKWLEKARIRYIIIDEVYPHAIKFAEALTNGWSETTGLSISFRTGNTFVMEVTPAFFNKGNAGSPDNAEN